MRPRDKDQLARVAGTTAAAGSMGRPRNPPAPSSLSWGFLFCQVQERAANRLYYLSAKIVQSVSGSLLFLTAFTCCENRGGNRSQKRCRRLGLVLYKILFYFRGVCARINSPFIGPLPPALSSLLQYYCTSIAQYTPRYRPSLCMPYTIPYWWW